jgi:uncharacterized protein
MRVTLDANVFASGLISEKGPSGRILARWQEERFELVVSPATLEELDRILHYPRIQQQYHLPQEVIGRLLRLLRTQATIVYPAEELHVVERDSADNRHLESARAGDASIIVSGDRHLLELRSYEGIQILSPAAFVTLLDLQG